jgi:hypothetical protein
MIPIEDVNVLAALLFLLGIMVIVIMIDNGDD